MKKTISEHINHYLIKHSGEEAKINEFANFIETFFKNIPDEHSNIHTEFYSEVENFAEEIDHEMILSVIECLRFKDGSLSGEKWSVEETQNVVKQYDVKNKIETIGKTFDCHRFWFALNYVYATHYSINRTINGYIDLAIDEYTNRNICFDSIIRTIFEKI